MGGNWGDTFPVNISINLLEMELAVSSLEPAVYRCGCQERATDIEIADQLQLNSVDILYNKVEKPVTRGYPCVLVNAD